MMSPDVPPVALRHSCPGIGTHPAADPLDDTTEWDGETSYTRTERTLDARSGTLELALAPAGVARVMVSQ